MSTYESYETLKGLVESCADDVAKSVGGNKAAGTRVRKTAQSAVNELKFLRKQVLQARSDNS